MREKGYNIINLAETDSTNEYAKMLAKDGVADKTVVIAEGQSAGKGRLGRNFDSEKGKGIFMSILLRPDITPEQASGLTLLAAMAVYDALKNVCGLDTGIKWPNDIVVDGRKLCGILTELSCDSVGVKYVVVGIGLNVLNDAFPEEICKVATSLYMLTGKRYSCEAIIEAILQSFNGYYEQYIEQKSLSIIRDIYEKRLIHTRQMIKTINGNEIFQGVCRGIGDAGELLIETDDGIKQIISGEISVRGVYGYV